MSAHFGVHASVLRLRIDARCWLEDGRLETRATRLTGPLTPVDILTPLHCRPKSLRALRHSLADLHATPSFKTSTQLRQSLLSTPAVLPVS